MPHPSHIRYCHLGRPLSVNKGGLLSDVRALRTHLQRLRSKLGESASDPTYFFAEPRVGYPDGEGGEAGRSGDVRKGTRREDSANRTGLCDLIGSDITREKGILSQATNMPIDASTLSRWSHPRSCVTAWRAPTCSASRSRSTAHSKRGLGVDSTGRFAQALGVPCLHRIGIARVGLNRPVDVDGGR